MLLVEGTVSTRNDPPSIWATRIESLEDSRHRRMRGVTVSLSTPGMKSEDLEPIEEICRRHPGEIPLWIRLRTANHGDFRVRTKRFRVSTDPELVRELRKLLGKENVSIG